MNPEMSEREYNFTVVIEPCEEGGFYAECPSLQGCHVQGETYEETLREMKSVIHDLLEDYQKDGQVIPSDEVTVTSLKGKKSFDNLFSDVRGKMKYTEPLTKPTAKEWK